MKGDNQKETDRHKILIAAIRARGADGITVRELCKLKGMEGMYYVRIIQALHPDDMLYEEGEGRNMRLYWCGN